MRPGGSRALPVYQHPVQCRLAVVGIIHLVCTVGVNFVDQLPVLILHVLEADIAQDTSVVDKDVHTAESLDGSVNDGLTVLHAVVVGNGLAARCSNLVYNNICSLEVDCQRSYIDDKNRLGPEKDGLTFEELPSPWWEAPRSLTTTLAPLEAKKVAYALPRPPPAPVTTTVWLSKRNSDMVEYHAAAANVKKEKRDKAETTQNRMRIPRHTRGSVFGRDDYIYG